MPKQGERPRKAAPVRKRDPFEGVRLEDCQPYDPDVELPPAQVDYKYKTIEGKRHTVARSIFCGEPRFYLERSKKGWFNLVGVYSNGKGTGRRNIRTLKPRGKRSLDGVRADIAAQVRRDRDSMKLLKANKIPIYEHGEI